MDFLKRENCNKTHCKSCIFHPDESKRIKLSQVRIDEINTYLTTMQSSHVCHQTNKTCYGGLEVTAKAMFALKIIPEQTVDSLLETAKLYLQQ